MRRTTISIGALALIAVLAVYGFMGQSETAAGNWGSQIAWTDPGITHTDIAADKPIFVFVTTHWCTYCRKMKTETLADPVVQGRLNDLFTNIVVNPETDGTARFTGEELSYRDLAANLGVRGYPTSFFFSPDGELLGGQPGYIGSEQMLDLASFIGERHYQDMTFKQYLAHIKK